MAVVERDLKKQVDKVIESVGKNAGAAWVDSALDFVQQYVAQRTEPFLTEDVRAQATPLIGKPRDGRAWGTVMRRAVKAGYVQRVGFAPAKSSNLSPKVLWQRGENTL